MLLTIPAIQGIRRNLINECAGKFLHFRPHFRGITRFRCLIALIALSFAGGLALLVYGAPPAGAQAVTDYDTDQDGLIEIGTLAQLNAIRWDLNGNGNPDLAGYIDGYNAAFPNRDNTAEGLMGCPNAACTGYELTANLDFDTDGDNDVDGDDAYPNWVPIPTYRAIFDGNGHTITRLTINTDARFAGLFGTVDKGGYILKVGMVDARVSGGGTVGGVGILVGRNRGQIFASYIQGGSVVVTRDGAAVGGLAGTNYCTIAYAYSTASVSGGNRKYSFIGGLVGVHYERTCNYGGGISYTYTAGAVSGATTTSSSSGLVGSRRGELNYNFCDITATMRTYCGGDPPGVTATSTSAMQSPTGYTGIYRAWYSRYSDWWDFGTASQYPTLNYESPIRALPDSFTDYDLDNDGLIDVSTLAQLNAIRCDVFGHGFFSSASAGCSEIAYDEAFPNRGSGMGCTAGCRRGYELITNLDFDTDGDNDVDANDAYPNWTPIAGYSSEFEGNGHTITRLTSSSTDIGRSGLFSSLNRDGSIMNVGMIDASVSGGGWSVGILVGNNKGTITASYARGGSVRGNNANLGGLVGINEGVIEASYSTAAVMGSGFIGGLVGQNGWVHESGAIIASYAAGALSSAATTTAIGGLVGEAYGGSLIVDSYYDTGATGQSQGVGAQASGVSVTAAGYNSSTLQTPTGYTGIYANWNIDLDGDGDGVGDDPWNFGTSSDYPTPKVVRVAEPKPEPELARRIAAGPVASSIEAGEPAPEASSPGPGNSGAPAPEAGYPEPAEEVYDPATAHPEVYANARYRMSASCDADGDGAVISFDLGSYAGPVALSLSLWDGEVFASYAAPGIAAPALEREGRTAQVRVATNPAQTRFRLDGVTPPRNLLLGYADCHADDG